MNTCPTCGGERVRWGWLYAGYLRIRPGSRQARRLIRRGKARQGRVNRNGSGGRSDTWIACTDPFHTAPLPTPPAPLPQHVHHPDLRSQKAALRRALQGKARR